MAKVLLLIVGLVIANISAYSQDKIYYKQNKIDDWKVTDVTPDYIKATDPQNAQTAYSTTHAGVLFVFNSLGNFLVVPRLFDKEQPDTTIKNFFTRVDNRFNDFDKIITLQNKIIICKYEKEAGNKIEFTTESKLQQISKSDVALVIFKTGEHKLVAGADKVLKVLNDVQILYNRLAAVNDKPVVGKTTNAVAVIKKDSSTGIGPSSVLKKLDSAALLKLQIKAIINIKTLESYIKVIAGKDNSAENVADAIKQALTLFVNEDARIEVSSATRGTVRSSKVKIYLNLLSSLNYDRVEIEWFNVQYTSQLKKGPDGFYYGVIEFEQRFTGVADDRRTYQDITRKTVEVVLKTYSRNVGGESILEWDVFLGNIGITETKPA